MQEIMQDFLDKNYIIKFKVDYLDIRKYWIESIFILNGISFKIGFVFTPDMHYTEEVNCNTLKNIINNNIINIYMKYDLEKYTKI